MDMDMDMDIPRAYNISNLSEAVVYQALRYEYESLVLAGRLDVAASDPHRHLS